MPVFQKIVFLSFFLIAGTILSAGYAVAAGEGTTTSGGMTPNYTSKPAEMTPVDGGAAGTFQINASRFTKFEQISEAFIKLLTGVVLLLTILTFMIGSSFWIFSAGNESLVERGKDLMIYSLVGILIVVGSYVIVRLFQVILYALGT